MIIAQVAQQVEQRTENPRVGSSILSLGKLNMTSKDKNTILNEALKYHHEGKLAEADNLYLKVLSLDKNDFNANHLHGCILSQRNDYEDAIKFITRAVEIIPSNYEANNNLGIAYKNLKDKTNAEKYFS